MSAPLPKAYQRGTHRTRSPEATFATIEPHLRALGVERCADVTGLDLIGIPTFCAIRPRGRVLQVSNGKGLRPIDAKVSALMEAIEFEHAEQPQVAFRHASVSELRTSGDAFAPPATLPGFQDDVHVDDRRRLAWIAGEDLAAGTPCWLPASAVYCTSPMLYAWSTNGLASGNHVVEATLHALYEVIERDTLSQLVDGDHVQFERCDAIDLATVRDDTVVGLRDLIDAAGLELVLLRAPSPLPIQTFMAVIVDPDPFALSTAVNVGYGAHLDVAVAVTRAITEAAQSRLTFIHGAREDLTQHAYRGGAAQATLREFFGSIAGDTDLASIPGGASEDLAADYGVVVAALRAADVGPIYRAVLTRPGLGIEVVKVLVAGTSEIFPM